MPDLLTAAELADARAELARLFTVTVTVLKRSAANVAGDVRQNWPEDNPANFQVNGKLKTARRSQAESANGAGQVQAAGFEILLVPVGTSVDDTDRVKFASGRIKQVEKVTGKDNPLAVCWSVNLVDVRKGK